MITSQDARWTFTASGPSGEFEIPRPVFHRAGLAALARNADGVEFYPPYEVVLKRDFSGATVRVTSGLSVGDKVVVYRVMRRLQGQELSASGPWPAATVERMIDVLTADMAAVAILLERAVGGSMLDDAIIGNIPAALQRAGKVQGYDEQGRPAVLSNVPLDPAVPVGAYMQTFLLNSSALDTLGDLGFSSFMASLAGSVDAAALLGELGFSAYFRSLLGAADAAALRSGLEMANLSSAFIDNGACQVAQIPAPVGLSTSPQHGPVDRFAGWASDGAVGAGTIVQNTSSALGRAGFSLRFSGVTLSGAGELALRYRMDTTAARRLRNANVSFGVLVGHDVGSVVNFTIHIRKPTVADNFTSTSVIQSSAALPVASGLSTGTRIVFENVALGDCTNGIEVEIRVACGAVTAKNFEFTEFVLAEAAMAPDFQSLNTFASNLSACQRFLRLKQVGFREVWSGVVNTGGVYRHAVRFDAPMRVAPTVSLSDLGVNEGFHNAAPTLDVTGVDGFDVRKQASGDSVGGYYTYSWRADARLAP